MKTTFFFLLLPTIIFANQNYKSQVGQDRYVNEIFFKNKRNGFFVDIGAHDGQTFSNSYFFEKELGWNGICFEPRHTLFEQLKACRNCISICACVSDKLGFVSFISIEGVDEMLSGIADTYDQRQMNIVMNDIQYHGGQCKTVMLPCIRLHDVLTLHNITHIDFLSVDTEGGELEILKTIDFDIVKVDVITVENNYSESHIREFLQSNGYLLVNRIHPDDIFVRRDFIS